MVIQNSLDCQTRDIGQLENDIKTYNFVGFFFGKNKCF